MRSRNFPKCSLSLSTFTSTEVSNQNYYILSRNTTQHYYYLLYCWHECLHSKKDQSNQTDQSGIIKQPAVGWIGIMETFSRLEYMWEVQEVSTLSPGPPILLILDALSQEEAVVFVLFAVREGKTNILLCWKHFTSSVVVCKQPSSRTCICMKSYTSLIDSLVNFFFNLYVAVSITTYRQK